MQTKKRTKIVVLMASFICLTASIALGQGPGFDGDVDDVPVPVDGGVTLIGAAAAAYGIKRLRDKRKV